MIPWLALCVFGEIGFAFFVFFCFFFFYIKNHTSVYPFVGLLEIIQVNNGTNHTHRDFDVTRC